MGIIVPAQAHAGIIASSGEFGAPAGDPLFANVVFLLDVDGQADGETTFTDWATGKAISRVGSTQVDTAESVNGYSGSILFAGSDWLTTAFTTDFNFPAEFVVETLVRFASGAGSDEALLGVWSNSGGDAAWFLDRSSNNMRFIVNGGADNNSPSWSPSNSTWYHVAVARDSSNVVRNFSNGVMLGKKTMSGNFDSPNRGLFIGTIEGFTGFAPLNGHIGAVRITKGAVRPGYDSDGGFTAPTTPFPRF